MSARREFSREVKFKALKRANGACEGCGMPLRAARFHFDHDIPDGLGGEPTLENCRVLCTGPGSCHDTKTRSIDVPRIAKAKRSHAKHIGARAPSRTPLPHGKNSATKRKLTGEVVPR